MFPGKNPDQVIKALLNRRGNTATDDRKIALVLEGGSLRGVYSCGAAHALTDLGFEKYFDVLIGTSSGALNTLYFSDARMDVAQSIYFENAVDKRCLDFCKFPEILNVNWMISTYILGEKHYSVDFVFSSNAPEIFISATNVETGRTRWFSNKNSSVHEFEQAILATAYTPIVCSQTENIGGERYNDGYLNASIPIDKALELGCTDVVVIPTQPWGFRKSGGKSISSFYSRWRLRNYSDQYKNAFLSRANKYNESLDLAASGAENFNTLVMAPQSSEEIIGSLETKSDAVKAAGELARAVNLDRLKTFIQNI